ncbi:HdeD family acid-resistance protein [Millionella massiliensis]|uniref:HdeD family acid-resistance protein n=1 Tax=Millionella massiliensis TaxID=1871023 RepID=UPI0024B78253|nr:DUF308 domain-containing protein [Millionella massiliensis]
MKDLFMRKMESTGRAVRNWWLLLLLGIAVFITGIFIFTYPGASYVALALTFAVLILVAGVVNIALAATNSNAAVGRGWLLAGGIMELLIGLMLMVYPSVSAATLPFFLAFWLMFRSLGLIGTGSDLMSLKVPGGLWTIIVGSLLLLCSVLILVHPVLFGVEAVVIWVGISFLMAGISLSVLAFELKSLHKHFSE